MASAHPHTTPAPVSVEIEVTKDGVKGTAIVQVPLLEIWLGSDWQGEQDTERAAVLEMIRKRWAVQLDGAEGMPTNLEMQRLDGAALPGMSETAVSYRLAFDYEGDTDVDQVHLKWRDFSGILWEDDVAVPVMVLGDPLSPVDANTITPTDPETTWRRRAAPRPPIERVDPDPLPPPTRGLPVPTLILTLLAVGFGFGAWRRKLPVSRIALAVLVPLGLAVALAGTGHVQVKDPFAPTSILPDNRSASRIFMTLHENMYRAFNAFDDRDPQSKEKLHDLIAVSVGESLIDTIYADTFESLTLRESGGVVCKVEAIEHLDGTIKLPENENARYFDVHWIWRVHGAFGHMGHTHRRINFYDGTFRIEHDGESWKIVHMELADNHPFNESDTGTFVEAATRPWIREGTAWIPPQEPPPVPTPRDEATPDANAAAEGGEAPSGQ